LRAKKSLRSVRRNRSTWPVVVADYGADKMWVMPLATHACSNSTRPGPVPNRAGLDLMAGPKKVATPAVTVTAEPPLKFTLCADEAGQQS
jgi:hypothetical protein